MQPTYFATPATFRAWLRTHHRTEQELIVGFYKKAAGKPSITYPEALDEALCFGWIDGVRHNVDASAYCIRFTPRRKGSFWSPVNTRKAEELIKAKRMQTAGLAAFRNRDLKRTDEYSYQRARSLSAADLRQLKRQPKAWAYFQALPPGIRNTSTWYVLSAKQDATRARRLATLIDCCARGVRLPGLPQTKRRA